MHISQTYSARLNNLSNVNNDVVLTTKSSISGAVFKCIGYQPPLVPDSLKATTTIFKAGIAHAISRPKCVKNVSAHARVYTWGETILNIFKYVTLCTTFSYIYSCKNNTHSFF